MLDERLREHMSRKNVFQDNICDRDLLVGDDLKNLKAAYKRRKADSVFQPSPNTARHQC